MISRIWHGYTTKANADAYESLEFVTIMWFDSLEAVREFAGKDYEKAVVPPAAQALLSRYDDRSLHYEVKAEIRTDK